MSTLPYSNATSGDKALAEIQRILQRFGCNRFGVMTDWAEGVLMVQPKFTGSWSVEVKHCECTPRPAKS